jgi:hypothetical protein
MLSFGKLTAFMNEATLHVLDRFGKSIPLEVVSRDCWFTVSADRKTLTPLATDAPQTNFQQVITTTGDLPATKVFFRIQIGKSVQQTPLVLGIALDGLVKALEYDPHDKQQLWQQLEWEKGRFLIHAESRQLLGTASGANTLELTGTEDYSSWTMWTLDTSNASTAGNNGFFRLTINGLSLDILGESGAIKLSPFTDSGCRFIWESTSYTLTWRSAVLKNFLRSRGPVFVHASGTPRPTNVPQFRQDFENLNSGFQAMGDAPKVYVIVRQSSEPIYLNYTDITYCLLYTPMNAGDTARCGWRFITARYNNTNNLLESVYFPGAGQGWMYNVDLNFSVMANPEHNPLKVIKRGAAAAKLHIYVDQDLVLRPQFPQGTTNPDILDASKWALSLDSGDEKVHEVVEAEMLVDDQSGSKPVKPAWMDSETRWTAGGEGQFAPVAVLDVM